MVVAMWRWVQEAGWRGTQCPVVGRSEASSRKGKEIGADTPGDQAGNQEQQSRERVGQGGRQVGPLSVS